MSNTSTKKFLTRAEFNELFRNQTIFTCKISAMDFMVNSNENLRVASPVSAIYLDMLKTL